MSRKPGQGTWRRAGRGAEGEPLRIYQRKTIGNLRGTTATTVQFSLITTIVAVIPLMRNTTLLLSRQGGWQKAET
jgi:hypothetical protein